MTTSLDVSLGAEVQQQQNDDFDDMARAFDEMEKDIEQAVSGRTLSPVEKYLPEEESVVVPPLVAPVEEDIVAQIPPSLQQTKVSSILPVLIVPGFMSSGLEIRHSTIKESWQGERIWINLKSLGFEAFLGGGSSSQEHGSKRHNGEDSKHGSTHKGEETMQQQQQQEQESLHLEHTNMWLQHMALSLQDQTTEHPQVQVRPMKGLGAVDYLTPGALTNHVSYVFGPVIEALLKVGYQEGVNLDAASYDWRLAPCAMEERDGYFTNTMKMVEQMYERNGNAPVVLLCHSLGAKVGHYLLNFCEKRQAGWCDKYIHTYIPVGGPHLGAPKAIRGVVTGDRMGLDVFLSESNSLALGRSFGSTPWLIPRELPSGAPCPCYIHRQGVIRVRIQQLVDVSPFFRDRESSSVPSKLSLVLKLGKIVAATEFLPVNDDMSVLLEGTFTFATDPKGPSDRLTVAVCEPGVSLARRKKRQGCVMSCGDCYVPLWVKILFCWHIVRYSIEFSLRFTAWCLRFFLWTCWVSGADLISKSTGGSSILAASKAISLKGLTSTIEETDMDVDLIDSSPNWRCCRRKERFTLTMHVSWIPPDRRVKMDVRASVARLENKTSSLESFGRMECTKHKKRVIEACSGYVLLKNENLDATLNTIERCYSSDENEPRRHTADDAPPVQRVFAIYGINLPTEVGAVYRRHTVVVDSDVTNYCTLDVNARLSVNKENGYVVDKGVVLETKATPQPSLDGVKCSGDGTVPYYSLQHVRTWEDSCSLTVVELRGAEHRDILADERFHKILIDYITRKSGIVEDDAVFK